MLSNEQLLRLIKNQPFINLTGYNDLFFGETDVYCVAKIMEKYEVIGVSRLDQKFFITYNLDKSGAVTKTYEKNVKSDIILDNFGDAKILIDNDMWYVNRLNEGYIAVNPNAVFCDKVHSFVFERE